tara:strand:- start:488 stop:1630 length:1143 start_codon:yes stop_codon:yes gene_type:complete
VKLLKSINKYWLGYFVVKIFYMFFALFVYQKFINPDRPVGDTALYLGITSLDNNDNFDLIFQDPTIMMEYFGRLSSSFLGPVFGNLPFMLIAFYGVYYSVSRLQLGNNQLLWILFLLSFPTFGIYSSIVGKEAVSIFYLGIIAGYLFDVLDKTRAKPKLIELLAFYLLFFFTPTFSMAIISVFIFIFIHNKLHLKGYGTLILFILHILLTIFLFYIYRDVLNDMSFEIAKHFSLDVGSTRENTIFVNDYDIFWNAPYGMLVAFWGPTFGEILQKPIQSIAFIESLIIFYFFILFIWRFLSKTIKTSHLNFYIFTLTFIVLFWILFAHYPTGVLNPGSALRYRERFYAFLVVFLFYFYSKYLKKGKDLKFKQIQKYSPKEP